MPNHLWSAGLVAFIGLTFAGCVTNQEQYEELRAEADRPLSELEPPVRLALPEEVEDAEERDPFADQPELTLAELQREVLERNPRLVAMHEAWKAAVAEYPQAVALEDPRLSLGLAPETISTPNVGEGPMRRELDLGVRADLSQQIPWPGKRTLRGEVALESARAAREELERERLELLQEAALSFYELWFTREAMEIYRENQELLREFKDIAEIRYGTGRVSKQDALQAEVDVQLLEQRMIELERQREVARARLNELLHRSPEKPLPPPEREGPVEVELAPAKALIREAIDRRPELYALASRLRAQLARLGLAEKDFFPDLTVSGVYNSLWQIDELRTMLGVGVNLPIWREKRHAAVEEALARIEALRAELASEVAQVRTEVQTAHERVREAERTLDLYDERLIPVAEENLEAARSAYQSGEIDFLQLLEAQRDLLNARLRRQQSVYEVQRRMAELRRAVGIFAEQNEMTEEMQHE